ncbi:MAG: nucleoside triphosphate pyrophosphohydrolase [Xanthomonadales bacterium]|nr:nucleoside triphosphate pyrophosphohydrolase [Xanthomonadales bacterium]
MLQLLEIMQRLRDPQNGCPWDVKQDFSSIAPYTIEEAYEVADAIARENMADLKDELGDLLFQVVFHAQMASEQGSFTFDDVHGSICDKMQRRHPHVFADFEVRDADHQTMVWEDYKTQERKQKGEHSLMDGIPAGMAELQRSVKLQKRAAKADFDWPSAEPVMDKFDEELLEMREAVASGEHERLEDELGDLLFVATNLARKLAIDPGTALRRSNAKFEQRFRAMEEVVGGHDGLKSMDLDEMEALWQEIKHKAGHESRN